MKYFDRPRWYLALLLVLIVFVAGLYFGYFSNSPDRFGRRDDTGVLVVAIIGTVALILEAVFAHLELEGLVFGRALRWPRWKSFRCVSKMIPEYRYVDMFRAAERHARSFEGSRVLETGSEHALSQIVSGFHLRKLSVPLREKFVVGPDQSEWFPVQRFWIVRHESGKPDTVLRIRQERNPYTSATYYLLEVATRGPQSPENRVDELVQDALRNSIYRNQMVRVETGEGMTDDVGTTSLHDDIRLLFCNEMAVHDEDIILDSKIHQILDRSVFSFHKLRERLAGYGIPQRKGILLHGPPGTGKTYACRYMYTKLDQVTALIVTGQSLLRLKSVCELARMLQPTLLVLEDVDLVFSDREINPAATTLGDMLDELDGFQNDDAIIVVLTTNAIDRVERAIKDRPGRISQCVFMAAPSSSLRERYLRRFLRDYDTESLDFDNIVSETRGASQAFLKELVFRSVQVAVERAAEENGGRLKMATDDFLIAVDEMTSQTEKAAASIIGLSAS